MSGCCAVTHTRSCAASPARRSCASWEAVAGRKTRWILEALSRRGHTTYFPIEISATALAVCRRELADIESVGIVGLEREYLDGLLEVAARRREGQRILVLFLGSTIGNFSSPADATFLREIRAILKPGDALLLGTDLEKPVPQLIAAYDDPLGVTAAFNLNLLARINRELEADFDLSQFQHVAKFNSATRSVEMHLRSQRRQTVTIPAAELTVAFQEGETIWTENIHKYSLREVTGVAGGGGLRVRSAMDRPGMAVRGESAAGGERGIMQLHAHGRVSQCFLPSRGRADSLANKL